MICKEVILFGLDKYKEIINKIIMDINVLQNEEDCFDIRLILTEILTNAFKYENKYDKDKPIYLKYIYDETNVILEINHTGDGIEDAYILNEACDKNLLKDCGRGLFLVKCIADKIEYIEGKLIVQKYLTNQGEREIYEQNLKMEDKNEDKS